MSIKRDKFLTERMNLCWHDIGTTIYRCCKCGQACSINPAIDVRSCNTDFSTPNGFFKLWNWSQTQDWWSAFLTAMTNDGPHNITIAIWLIHPDRFANAVYEYLKEREQ